MRSMDSSSINAQLIARKRRVIWAIVSLGAVFGIVLAISGSPHGRTSPIEYAFSILFGFCVLDWCLADSRQRFELLTRGRTVLILWLPILGLPLYFIRSRGIFGAAKMAYGYLFSLILFTSTVAFALFV